MAENLYEVIGVAGVSGNAKTHSLDFEFRLNDDSVVTIRVPLGAIPKLAVGLRSEYDALSSIQLPKDNVAAQPMKFREANLIRVGRLKKGINIRLDIFDVPILLNEAQAVHLKTVLEQFLGLENDQGNLPRLDS